MNFLKEVAAVYPEKELSALTKQSIEKCSKEYKERMERFLKCENGVARCASDIDELKKGKYPPGIRPFRMPFVAKEWDEIPATMAEITITPVHGRSYRQHKEHIALEFARINRDLDKTVEDLKYAHAKEKINFQLFVADVLAKTHEEREKIDKLGIPNTEAMFKANDKEVTKQAIQTYRKMMKAAVKDQQKTEEEKIFEVNQEIRKLITELDTRFNVEQDEK